MQADTRTTSLPPPRRDDVDYATQRMRPPSREGVADPTVCGMLCFLVWFDGVGDVVAILGIYGRVGLYFVGRGFLFYRFYV